MKTTLSKIQGLPFIFLLVASLLIIAGSCKSKKTSDSKSDDKITVDEAMSDDNVHPGKIGAYPIPTSFEVTKLLVEAGASYILDLCNNVDNVNKYISLKSKALNLGVYGADLSYAATYNQSQETMQYLGASAKLIEELHISSAFNETLVGKVEKSLDNVDELITIISNSFNDTYEYLNENEQDKLSVLVMAGSWIEALYITTQISIISQDNTKIVDVIAQQKVSLAELIKIIEPIKADEMASDIYRDLSDLEALFKGTKGHLNKEQLAKIISLTEKIRMQIVS